MAPFDPLAWAITAFRDDTLARRYALYQRYFDGDQDLAFATAKFESAFGRLFEAFAYNRAAVVVDAHADRLHVTGFAGDDESQAAQAKAIWDHNRMDKRQGEVYAEAFTTGDGYLLVWPDERTGGATLWPQPAANVRVRYHDERPGEAMAAAKRWTLADGRIRLNVYEPDRIQRFVTKHKAPAGMPVTDKLFAPFDDDGESADFRNPYDTVPIIPFANNARTGALGRSELADVIPVQDALNKTLTDKMVAMEMAAYPQRVILGLEKESAPIDPLTGTVAVDPATGQPVDPLAAPLQKFQVGMDRILTLTGANVKIAEFQAVALAQFIAVAEFWDTAVSRVSKVPVHYLALSGGFPSGRALRTAEAPFVAKLEDRQRAIGNGFEDAMQLALKVEKIAEPEPLSTLWRSAAPMSAEDDWDLALQKSAVGLPVEQILTEMGYDEGTLEKVMALIDGERSRIAEQQERATMLALAGDEPDDADAERDEKAVA